jgi:hypothetical protein
LRLRTRTPDDRLRAARAAADGRISFSPTTNRQ